jgi:hypothetical protein
MPNIQQSNTKYEQLAKNYIAAIHAEEDARLKGLPTTDSDTVSAWLDACKTTEQINNARIECRADLLRALNPKLYP